MMEEVVRQADSQHPHNAWAFTCHRLGMTVGYDSNVIVSVLKKALEKGRPR